MALLVSIEKNPDGEPLPQAYVNIADATFENWQKAVRYRVNIYRNKRQRELGGNPIHTQIFTINYDGSTPLSETLYNHLKTVNYCEPDQPIACDFRQAIDDFGSTEDTPSEDS